MKTMLLATAASLTFAAAAQSATLVTAVDGSQGWTDGVTNSGGTAEIVDLTGTGGTLETNAPLPTGAVKLTTDSSTSTRAEVGIGGSFGTVSDIFNDDFQLSYSWFDTSGTAVAAPSIKLAFYNAGYAGDVYGQLIFEPYWQGSTPTQGDWVTSTFDLVSGLSWSSGMFNLPTSAGGPPLRTLAEWLNEGDSGFAGAQLVGISVGLGTSNTNEIGYFDNVSLSINGETTTWDFETVGAEVPLPAGLPLLIAGLGAFGLVRRNRKTA